MAGCLPELARAIGADSGAAFLLSVDSAVCELSQKIGYPELRTASAVPLSIIEGSPLNDAIRQRELLVVAPGAHREANHRAASETIPELREGDIVLPLMTDGRVVGAIVLAGMKSRIVQGDEREFLIAAGRQTARAIDRAQLYETAERGRTEAEALRVDADAALHELQKAQEALRLSEARCRTLAARSNRLYEFSAGLSEAVALDAVAARDRPAGKGRGRSVGRIGRAPHRGREPLRGALQRGIRSTARGTTAPAGDAGPVLERGRRDEGAGIRRLVRRVAGEIPAVCRDRG